MSWSGALCLLAEAVLAGFLYCLLIADYWVDALDVRCVILMLPLHR